MAKKSILYLVTQSEWGGAQRYIFDLATNLNPQEYQVIVAAGEDPNGLLFKKLQEQGIKTFYLKYLKRTICPYADLRAFFELRNLISQIKPDIVHLNSSKAGVLGSLAIKLINVSGFRFQVSSIYTAHGWVFNEPLPWWLKKLYFWAEKISARWKDKIICVSEFDRQMALKTRLCQPEKLVTIHNGIDVNQMEFLSKEQSRASLGLSQGTPLIGTVAHFYPTKGLKYLVEAAYQGRALLKQDTPLNLCFVIIGDGPERAKLEKLIKKYHLENNFFLLGEIPQAAKYLKAFNIFVLSSVKEGFPYTILEAMAAQVPIVATEVGGIKGSPTGLPYRAALALVQPKNSQALAEKIIYLLKHPEIAQSLAQKARGKIEKEFSLEKMVQQTEKLYQ